MELLIFISAPVRTNFHYEVSSRSTHFFGLYNSVIPSGVRHISHYVISQVSLFRDDVVFAVLEVPVSQQFCFLGRGELSYHQDVTVDDTPVCVGQGSASRLTAWRSTCCGASVQKHQHCCRQNSTLDGSWSQGGVSVAEKHMSIVFAMEAGRFEPSPERPQQCFLDG